ncbi:hypothetical protein [Pseudoalteromonas sp. Of7M-16]|uniref:hypothetical protein n=1 Tax=Pseudoalteromonas sp. Of7M-16 TaxID=2917756 RepID=UPI001EF6003A|nr:hypothetical protein [Pseudoalteromonas sp. Of7M-16]MCG7550819.1 hypothetical protein [Pseudoalteromonas sp. Of7M-16]
MVTIEELLKHITSEQYQAVIVILFGAIFAATAITYKYVEKHFKLSRQSNEDEIIVLKKELDKLKKAGEKVMPSDLMKIYDFSGENSESEKHLLSSLSNAKEEIFVFGLTRNFYSDDKIQKILVEKCKAVPVKIFMMDPDGKSKKERYRLEPSRAAYRNSDVYKEKVEKTFLQLIYDCKETSIGSKDPGICFNYYDFPCSFAMEKIDREIRVFLYGYGKRGTDSPTFVFREGHTCYEYFSSQIDWIKEHGAGNGMPQWHDSDIVFTNLATKALQRESR